MYVVVFTTTHIIKKNQVVYKYSIFEIEFNNLKSKEMAKTYIAQEGEDVYNLIFSAPSFVNIHKELLDNVLSAIAESSKKRLLVLGTGPSGSPYNTVPDKFKRLFKNKRFKAVFLDYSSDVLASCSARFNELGITGEKGLDSQIMGSEGVEEKDLEDKLTFFKHDLRDPLPELGKYDVIESSFTLHHAAQYTQTLTERLAEIYNSLDKNGLFILTTGFVDMSYSEKKVMKIGKEAAKSAAHPITLIDGRQPDYPYKLTFYPDKEPELEKADTPLNPRNQVIIDKYGLVHVPIKFIKSRTFLGYAYNSGFCFTFPLIDPKNEEDKELLVHVRNFYTPTGKEIENVRADHRLVSMAVKADRQEAVKAGKGLAEYYKSKEDLLALLKSTGFKRIEVKNPNKDGKGFEDLVNILCYKV